MENQSPVPSSRPHTSDHGYWLTRGTHVAWSIAIAMLVIAALRIVAHDATYLLICVNSFTLYLYLPAYLILIFAAGTRRYWLAAVSLLLVACHVAWVAPDFRPAATPVVSAGSRPATKLRVFWFNVNRYNEEFQATVDEITRVYPDVIVLGEMFHTWKGALLEAHITERYPYGTNLKDWQHGDVVVFSHVPIENLITTWVVGRAYLTFDVQLDGRPLHFFCLHSPRPMNIESHDYRGFWKDVLPAVRSQPRPLIVVGDFNSTQHSWIYRQIIDAGLRSAHVDRGRGYATTWPNGTLPLPPIRIDQAFLSPEVECLRCVEGTGAGSDHRPLVLDIQLRQDGNDRGNAD